MNGRPIWELKLIACLLLAVSLFSYLLGIIDHDLFMVIFTAVFNYIALNASQSKFEELKLKVRELGALKADPPVKLAAFLFGIICGIAYYVHALPYDVAIKVLTLVGTILASNFAYLEYKLSKL